MKGGKFPKNKSAFTLKSGNTTPFKQMGASQFTRSLQRRAFGTGTNPRDGAKMLNTSTWNYNKMKKKLSAMDIMNATVSHWKE